MSNSPKRPGKRRTEGSGRVTPKGGPKPRSKSSNPNSGGPGSSTRYTPPVKDVYAESPKWIPVVMFGLFAVGMLVIFLHYVEAFLPGAASNWYLLVGLGAILGGILTATQYR